MIHPYSHIHIYLQNIDFNISLLGDFYAMEIAGAVLFFFPKRLYGIKDFGDYFGVKIMEV